MDDMNRYTNENNEIKEEKNPLWKKVGVFFIAVLMAAVTVFIMNI